MECNKTVLSVKELAALLGICLPSAYELVKRDGFPAVQVSARRIVIPAEKFNEWLNEQASKNSARV